MVIRLFLPFTDKYDLHIYLPAFGVWINKPAILHLYLLSPRNLHKVSLPGNHRCPALRGKVFFMERVTFTVLEYKFDTHNASRVDRSN